MYQKYHKGKPLYELVAANGEDFGSTVHPLFLGIHTSTNVEWKLREWIPPKDLLSYEGKKSVVKKEKASVDNKIKVIPQKENQEESDVYTTKEST